MLAPPRTELTLAKYTVSQKNVLTLKRYSSKLQGVIYEIWQKYTEYSRIEFVCFSFYEGLLVITLSSLKLHTKNNACVDVFISTCTARSAAAWSPVGCSELSQLHQQPICYKLLSVVTFTFLQTFDQDFVFFTERRHGLQGM